MYREENNESHFGLALIYPTNLTNESKSLTLVQISLTLSINHGSFNNYVGLRNILQHQKNASKPLSYVANNNKYSNTYMLSRSSFYLKIEVSNNAMYLT
jgi:hypothetical protein